ncbi:MAG: DUF512 domain-containing protein [Desulfuromonadales bacterium]|nr:DUF512 domain-containing protein [Desulfuromonadales bacterium]
MLPIVSVDDESIAAELELEPGDQLLYINNQDIADLLDYLLYEAREELTLEVRKSSGEVWVQELEKDAGMPLGLHFEDLSPQQCGNNCIFCFVHQLPRGMRRSLYVKDEDYRFSYLYGSYITLSNLDEDAVKRIIAQRLSPLYVSVHAVNDQLRSHLLGKTQEPILPLLQRLVAAGIELHTQIVLCPGINDGEVLVETIKALATLRPGVLSLAVVPLGLTGHRAGLPALRMLSTADAEQVLRTVEAWQHVFLDEAGERFVFAADELYLLAGHEFPPLDDYEELPQLENGVGLLPLFRADAEAVLEQAMALPGGPVTVISGESAATDVKRFCAQLSVKTGVKIHVVPIRNDFFGGGVTVAGLLTGGDIMAQLKGYDLGVALLVPAVICRDGDDTLLDDVTLTDLAVHIKTPVIRVEPSPWGILAALETLSEEMNHKEKN